jgi:hypothetical protein
MSDLEVGYEYGRYTLRYNVQNNIVRDNKSLVLTPESNKGVMMDDKLFIAEGNSLSVIPIEEPRP